MPPSSPLCFTSELASKADRERVEAVMAGICGLRRRQCWRFGDWGLWVKGAAAFWWMVFVSSELFCGLCWVGVWLCKVGVDLGLLR